MFVAVAAGLTLLAGCGEPATVAGRPEQAPARPPLGNPAGRAAPGGDGVAPVRDRPADRPVAERNAPRRADRVDPHADAVAQGRQAFESQLPPDAQRLAATVVVRGIGDDRGATAFVHEQLQKAAGQFFFDLPAGMLNDADETRPPGEGTASRERPPLGIDGVWYNDAITDAEVGESRLEAGPVRDDERTYYLFPIDDLNGLEAAVHGIQQVSTDPATRTVTMRAFLPDPLPDGAPDRLADTFREEQRVRLVVKYDADPAYADAQESWIARQAGAQGLGAVSFQPLSVAIHRWDSKPGEVTLSVAPILDLTDYRGRVPFGSVTSVDPVARRIEMTAKVPSDVVELEKEAAAFAKTMQRVTPGQIPGADEAPAIWAAGVVGTSDDVVARENALRYLMQTRPEEVTEDERTVIREALALALRTPKRTERVDLLKLSTIWRPDGYAETLRDQLTREAFLPPDRLSLLRDLASVDDPAANTPAAEAALALAEDPTLGDDAVRVLQEMGPAAEDAVLKRLIDPDPAVRRDIATLLSQIGTAKSIDRLLERSKAETDPTLARHMRAARVDLRRRILAREAAE